MTKSQIQNPNESLKSKSLKYLSFVIGIFICHLSFGFCHSVCYASNKAALVREGNQLYNKGKLDEALKSYNQALTAAPDEPLINFNIANSLYKKAQYGEAIKAYEKALTSSDKKTEAKANYNIGNCKFRQGKVKESSDLAGAIAEYRQSLDYYKRAMELDPDDRDAKFNHEFVERLLKTLLDKLAKQQQKEQKDEGERSEAKPPRRGRRSAKRSEASPKGTKDEEEKIPQQQSQQEQKEAKETQGQQQAQEAQRPKETKQEGQEQQQEYQPGGDIAKEAKELDKEMTNQEAGILLDDYRQQEQQERQLGDKRAPMRYPDVEKDW